MLVTFAIAMDAAFLTRGLAALTSKVPLFGAGWHVQSAFLRVRQLSAARTSG
jgi:hypothetical protein